MTSRSWAFALGSTAGAGALWTLRHRGSPAVRAWAPGLGDRVRTGTLSVRTFGAGDPVLVLLHGLAGAGDAFGSAFDDLGQHATVLVPDLLGFGASMEATGPMNAATHGDALDEMLDHFGLRGRPLVVAGHSMGGSMALRWAARHVSHVRTVLTFGAPLYRDRAEADVRLRAMGRIEASLAGDAQLARTVCDWMCRHRTTASWLAAAHRPDLPVHLARRAVEHTWASYAGAVDALIRDGGWRSALAVLAEHAVKVTLVEGAADPVPVPGRAVTLSGELPTVDLVRRPGGHDLPLTDPTWCAWLVRSRLDTVATAAPKSAERFHAPPV